jgi:hypothetical protein
MTRLHAFLSDERGTATIEFVMTIPIILMIFFASFESGLYMIRHVMLERSVDIVVRDIRLGNYSTLTHRQLKEEVCKNGLIGGGGSVGCQESMRIWMQPINTATFDMVAPPNACVDKSQPIDPDFTPGAGEFAYGTDNEIMLLRICVKAEPLFPSTIVGAGLTFDQADGNYALVTTSVFVNEPG